jgi:hypothetical protein
MSVFFTNVSPEERANILDQHKHIYDGYVTQYGQGSNMTPLTVQDFANDKGGITVSNKGDVKAYTNMGINEDIDRKDRIGDGPMDLPNGTVDVDSLSNPDHDMMHDGYPSPSDEDDDNDITVILSMDELDEDDDETIQVYDVNQNQFDAEPVTDFSAVIDEEILPEFMEKLNESLDMFRRFNKYN